MSRRPNPTADRAEQNRQTLKSLVKLDANKSCADCKRNKHPRWASWNLGIFVCIRCSGIHRGMGTHISRVKSVDLDSWTDEQLQSMLKWGNARANKYWEAKLAPGHVPSEAKIENFIRTKYESKRWVMDGGIPDPSTLDAEGDDDVEKVKIERSLSQRAAAAPARPSAAPAPAPPKPQPTIDLFGDDISAAPPRPSTGPPLSRNVPPKADPAPPKQTKAGDSLLGLDFLGGPQSAPPARPSSTSQTTSAPSRPDLKQSILSLYATAPKPAPKPQPQHGHSDSFGGLVSPGMSPQQPATQQGGLGGLNDAFSSLSFGTQPAQPQQQPKASPFSGLDSFASTRSPPSNSSSMFGGGGSFFDSTPKSPPVANPPVQKQRNISNSSGFGDFSSFTSPAPSAPAKPAATSTSSFSGMNDLLDLSMPAPASQPAAKPAPLQTYANSAFNLSSPAAPSAPKPAPAATMNTPAANFSNFGGMDAWGSTDAWASSGPAQTASTTTSTSLTQAKATSPGGWGQTATPQITQDDDFGGWSSATPAAPSATTLPQTHTHAHMPGSSQQKPGGFGGGDDLFSNVWE